MTGRSDASVFRLLRRVPLFQNIDHRSLRALAGRAERLEASAKQMIFREGDRCTGMHIVVYGRIKISLIGWNGAGKPIQIVGPGGGFGDITMFLGDPYYRYVQAIEDSLLIHLPLSAMQAVIRQDGDFAMQLLTNLAEKVRGLVQDIESFSLQPPAARLITYLLRMLPPKAGPMPVVVKLEITKTTIAAQLNVTPETLSRQFKELSDLGLVSVKGRTVTVFDVEKLGNIISGRRSPGSALQTEPRQLSMAMTSEAGASAAVQPCEKT